MPRSPQGRPVIVQAGGSDDMIAVAGEVAEVIFCAPLVAGARAGVLFRASRRELAKHGRTPDEMKMMPGLSVFVAPTEEEARAQQDYLNSLIHPIVAREILSMVLGGIDLSRYSLRRADAGRPADTERQPEHLRTVLHMARSEKLTMRQVAVRVAGARGKSVVCGSPQQVADHMERWFVEDACDGFNVMPPFLPGSLDDFVNLVIPELQRRGLFRTEYEGTTLARTSRPEAAGKPIRAR